MYSIRSILVPLDGSTLSEQALPLALAIARGAGAKVHLALVHVAPPAPMGSEPAPQYATLELGLREWETAYLSSLATTLRSKVTVPVSSALLDGPIAPTLTDFARGNRVDLIVMTTHGRGPAQRAWLGSVADALVRSARVPVLLVRAAEGEAPRQTEPAIGRILVALDGSPRSESVLPHAAGLARLLGSELTLVRVVMPAVVPLGPAPVYTSVPDPEVTEMLRQEAEEYLAKVSQRLREEGCQVTSTTIVAAPVAATILELAQPGQVGLVALATHGRGGVRRLVLGSVADKVVRGAQCPVLVCRGAVPRGGATA